MGGGGGVGIVQKLNVKQSKDEKRVWLKYCLTGKMEMKAFDCRICSTTLAAGFGVCHITASPSGTKLNFLLLFISGTMS